MAYPKDRASPESGVLYGRAKLPPAIREARARFDDDAVILIHMIELCRQLGTTAARLNQDRLERQLVEARAKLRATEEAFGLRECPDCRHEWCATTPTFQRVDPRVRCPHCRRGS